MLVISPRNHTKLVLLDVVGYPAFSMYYISPKWAWVMYPFSDLLGCAVPPQRLTGDKTYKCTEVVDTIPSPQQE